MASKIIRMFLPDDHNQFGNVAMGPNISVSEDPQLKVKSVELPHRRMGITWPV
jgi:hypothetical protein